MGSNPQSRNDVKSSKVLDSHGLPDCQSGKNACANARVFDVRRISVSRNIAENIIIR